ncbi:hypothetical protein BG004_008246 [Podila humilis]|nr:hypothetical protein BG004_008246 [Podila humilis]
MEICQSIRQKRLRAGTACTNCRRKKLRCTGTPNCVRCVTHKLDCVVDEVLFLKTNSAQALFAKTHGSSSSRPPHSLSSAFGDTLLTSPILASHPSDHIQRHQHQLQQQRHQQHTYRPKPSSHFNQPYQKSQGYPHHGHHHSTLSSASSCSADDLMERRHSMDFSSDRRLSTSSQCSSPCPSSPGYLHNLHFNNPYTETHPYSNSNNSSISNNNSVRNQDFILSHPSSSSKFKKQTTTPTSSSPSSHVDSGAAAGAAESSTTSSSVLGAPSKKRLSKDHDTSSKPKQKRKNSKHDSGVRSAPETDENTSQPHQKGSPNVKDKQDTSKKEGLRSVVSTMSLDGHGQHFHGSSSGFYVCQLSTRYRQGVYPLPMAHLNDSDLWSHSLQVTSERELPPKEIMENLLDLYFRYMYPFAPIFIRRSFMNQYHSERPDLSQILILNSIFCNACWYSDDPAVKQDSTKYFNRAKIILDETYHVSRISTIQALLLMSHHQYAVGNYSGGWLYTGMASRIAHDIGLHRQDVQANEPEEGEVQRRVWWAIYISDRLGCGVLGRPVVIDDKNYSVQMPSDDGISEIGDDDKVEYPFEPERIISCRLLWSVKLFMQMGNVLNTMHCIEAEVNGNFLADISRTQLPQLHNRLTSWFLALPNELMYTPYTMSPNSDHPPSPPTALVHMFYYTTLTMLHRPYLRPVNSDSIDANFLVSSRNICTAAATNVCHIADSLMLHGQLRDTCYYGMTCLLAAGTVHIHNAITPTPSNRETTRAGLSKTVKAAHELVRTFPMAESLIAVALDVFASQTSSVPAEMAASFIDISTFVAPFMGLTQLQSTSIGNIYEAARLAKQAKDGPGPAPSIQLRHPYGNFSMPLPEQGKDQTSSDLSNMWQSQIATAVSMAAIAFGGTDPLQQEQQFFASPMELPEALRLAPIDTMELQIDPLTAGGSSNSGIGSFGDDTFMRAFQGSGTSSAFVVVSPESSHLLQHQQQSFLPQQQQQQQQNQQNQQSQLQQQQQASNLEQRRSDESYVGSNQFSSSAAAQSQSLMQELSSTLSATLHMEQSAPTAQPVMVPLQGTSSIIQNGGPFPPEQSFHQQTASLNNPQLQQKKEGVRMEDDTADPPSPPAISSDDMESDEFDSPEGVEARPRQDAQTQCDDPTVPPSSTSSSSSLFTSLLSTTVKTQEQEMEEENEDRKRKSDVEKMSTLLFD